MDSYEILDLSNDLLEVQYPEHLQGTLPSAVFGQISSFNSADTAWATYRDLNQQEVNIYIGEEKSFDTEVDFLEDVSVLLIWVEEESL